MYEYLIIGGGISGLYCVDLLIDKYNISPNNICIIEKNNRWGGRIYTKYNAEYNITYEAGANRVPDSHTLTINLLKKYNLGSNITPIDNSNELKILIDENIYNIDNNIIEIIINNLLKLNIDNNRSHLITKTLSQYCIEILGIEQTNLLINSYGYNDDFYIQNAYDGLKSLKRDFNNQYNIVKDGFSQLIHNMVKRFTEIGVNLRLGKKCIKWEWIYNFNVNISDFNNNNEIVKCKKLILALDQWSLLQLPQLSDIYYLLNTVKSTPLTKIYALFENKPISWFSGINKITTNIPLRMFIPIDESKGFCLLSYSDGYFAKYWQQLSIKNNLLDQLMISIKKLFNDRDIKEPIFIDKIHWYNGAHLWPVNVDSNYVYHQIIKPYINKEIYICNEAYSNYQGWIQGSLDMAERVCLLSNTELGIKRKIFKKDVINSKYLTIIHNKVYDISSWIDSHPGGEIIKKAIGIDSTHMFEYINHPEYTKKILNNFYIGDLF